MSICRWWSNFSGREKLLCYAITKQPEVPFFLSLCVLEGYQFLELALKLLLYSALFETLIRINHSVFCASMEHLHVFHLTLDFCSSHALEDYKLIKGLLLITLTPSSTFHRIDNKCLLK